MPPLITSPQAGPREVRLRDLKAGDETGMILARVVTADRREVMRRSDGGRRPIVSGLLSDGTATVRFTWWDPPREGIEKGLVLRATQFQIREFQGRLEVAFNWRSQVEPASEAELPAVSASDLPLRRVAELSVGDEGFRLETRVLSVAPKTVTVGEDRRRIFEGTLADSSGSVAFTAWVDFRLEPDQALRVSGAYVRAFRGRPQVILDQRSQVDRPDGLNLPAPEELHRWPICRLAMLEAQRGAERVEVEGVVVATMPPTGVIYRCPTCTRSLTKGACRVHGTVEGQPDLRARIVLDDGTGAGTLNAGRAETEHLLGHSLEWCLEKLRKQPDPAIIEEEILRTVFGRTLTVRGRATVDDFGVTLHPSEILENPRDPSAEARELRTRLAGNAR